MGDTGIDRMQQDAAGLAKAARDIEQAEKDLGGLLSSLDQEIGSGRGQWQGAGAAAFFALFESWHGRTRAVVQALATFRDNIDVTRRLTGDVDRQQDAAVRAIAARMSGVAGTGRG